MYRFKVGVCGFGHGGNNIAASIVLQSVKGTNYGSYIAVDTNLDTVALAESHLKTLPEGVRVEEFESVLLETNEDGTEFYGSGVRPDVAKTAFLRKKDKLIAVLGDIRVLYMCFALGKGTGTGTLFEALKCVLELKYIIPVVIVSVPSKENGECTPGQAREYESLLIKVMGLGVRIIQLDTTALTVDERLKNLPVDQAWAALDLIIAQTLSGGLGYIFNAPSQIDYRDIANNLVGGAGNLVVIHGRVSPEAGEAEFDFNSALTKVWQGSAPPYFEKGPAQKALLVTVGPWTHSQLSILRPQIRQHFNGTEVAEIISANFPTSGGGDLVFSVLCATEPNERLKISPTSDWVWTPSAAPTPAPKPPQNPPSPAAPVSANSSGAGEGDSASGDVTSAKVAAEPAPNSEPTPEHEPSEEIVEKAQMVRTEVYSGTQYRSRITFTNLVIAARGKENAAALELLGGQPDYCIQILSVIARTLDPNSGTFHVEPSEVQDNLERLANLSTTDRLSGAWKQWVVQQMGQVRFTEAVTLSTNTGGSVTVRPFQDSDEDLTKAGTKDLTAESLTLLRQLKWLRQTVGPELFRSFKAAGNGGSSRPGMLSTALTFFTAGTKFAGLGGD